jgi:putative heme-binding domain-containing protein
MYVVDMHRAVIEHPAWMPKELQQRGDLRWGNTAGRIYRIVAENVASKGKRPAIDFEMAPAVELVDALGHPNRWRRETAARRIVEEVKFGKRIDIDAVAPLLRDSIASGAETKGDGISGRGATRALWLLNTLGRLTMNELASATRHPDAAVRLQAVRLLAMRPGEPDEEIQKLLGIQAEDSNPLVRYQFLLEWAMRGSDSIRAKIAASARPREGDAASDRVWIGNALSLVSEPIGASLLRDALADPAAPEGSAVTTWGPLAKRLGWAGSAETLAALMGTKGATADGLFGEFASGLAVRGTAWATLSEKLDPAAKVELGARLNADRQRVLDESLPMEQRLVAFRRVSLDRGDATRELCLQILKGRGDELFVESLQTVRHFPVDKLPELLVSRVTQLPPRATTAVVAAMIGNASWTPNLLDAIEAGNVPWGLIDPTSMGRLQRHSDAAIAQRVKTMLAGRTTVDRQELVRKYTEGLAQNANPFAGKAVFVKQCAGCHRIDGQGVVVGPDISDMRTQTPEQILLSILDPNAAIDANFYRYAVLTADGQLIEGLLEESNQQSVTLRLQDGVRKTLPRDEIEQFRATGVSMMPEGFENQISPEAMRDLVAYLKRWRLLSGEIPLGQK